MGGRLPEQVQGERPGLVPIPLLLASILLGLESFLRCLGKEPMFFASSQPAGGKETVQRKEAAGLLQG